jgi:fatty-acyl-CoA synthase
VLDALPLTAVGKIYKPALRVRAIELKLQELLSAAAAERSLQVRVTEQGASPLAQVRIEGPPDAALQQRLRQALGAIAVRTEFSFSG